MLKIILLTILILIPIIGQSQSVIEDQRVKDAFYLAEQWIEAQRAYEQIPGISLTFVYNGDLIWRYAVGTTDLEKQTPTTPETIYSICSISKLFTSIAIMQLRDQGKLRLDDPVSKHLPWYRIKQTHPGSGPVTIQGILTHSSGLPRESDFPYWNAPDFNFPIREDMIKQLPYQEMLYPADTYYQYSNLGLTLAGEIVAQVSGQKFDQYVTAHIIEPLQLTDTRPYMPEDLYGKRLATGYSARTRSGDRNKLSFFQANAIVPAAGFTSTAQDLAKFAAWQLQLLAGERDDILAANTLREMHRVHWLDQDWATARGLGFGVYRDNDVTFVGHGGSCPGYRSSLIIQPQSGVAVVFMANASGVDASSYSTGVYHILAPVLADVADSTGEGQEVSPDFRRFIGTYSFDPWGGEAAVVPWNGELAMADFPSEKPPLDLTRLKHIKDNKFKRIRDDGQPGEEIIFEIDDDGRVVSMKQHSNYWPKIK
jgi:CubicO group peptidase (beta-lactamase class C family)